KLPERALEALQRLQRRAPQAESRMFPDLSTKALDKGFYRLQDRLNISPRGRPYDLRHTAITHAIAYAQVTPGVSIADVARWAGHSRNSTTLDTYCHVLDSSPGLGDVMAMAYRAEL